MRTNNDHIEELLPDFIKGRLRGTDRERVERHLAECGLCRTRADELGRLFRLIDSAKEPDVPTGFFQNLLPRIRQRIAGKRRYAWFEMPAIERLVLPGIALTLASVFALQMPQMMNNGETPGNHTYEFLDNYTSEEILDSSLDENIAAPSATAFPGQDLATVLSSSLLTNELAGAGIADEGGEVVFVSMNPTQRFVYDLSENEVDVLLQRLSERKVL